MAPIRKDDRKDGKHDDPLAGVTSRALQRSDASASACPDASVLAAYFERSLTAGEAAQHEQHFAACARCQQQLAVMVRLDSAVPLAATDPSPAAERGWRAWNWKIWAPAAAAFGAVALWIMSGTFSEMRAPIAPAAGTEIAANRAPAESAPLPADALSGKDAAAIPTRRAAGEGLASAKPAPAAGPRRQESLPLAGRADLPAATMSPATVPAAPPAPAKDALQEFTVTAKNESAESAKLRDVEKKKQDAEADARALAAAQEKVQVEAADAARAAQQPSAPLANRSGAVGGLSRDRSMAMMHMPSPITVHAPAPSLALWRISGSKIEVSADSGRTWKQQSLPPQTLVIAGSAVTERICWLVGESGAVLRTTDGGAKWEKLPAPAAVHLTGIEARDAENATVVAADGRRFLTSDAGRTWRLL